MPDFSSKTARKRLTPRDTAYFVNIGGGKAIGYRRRYSDRAGKWVVRTTSETTGKYEKSVIGDADDFIEADGQKILSYTQALAAISRTTSPDAGHIYVQDALDDWAAWKSKTASSNKQRTDFANTAKRIGKAFGKLTLKSIKPSHIIEWRDSFIEREENRQPRTSTANRSLANLKAALNKAADEHQFDGNRTWNTVKKFSSKVSHGARMVILTTEQEEALISAARSDLALVLRSLQLTGARYGEIRQILCEDIHKNQLFLRAGKTGQRTIVLSDARAEWFNQLAKGRSGNEHLLLRRDLSPWPDGGHLKLMRSLVKASNLPAGTSSYSLRHKFISDALTAGVPIAAVAKHCGTSVEMIIKNYAKFATVQMKEWFA